MTNEIYLHFSRSGRQLLLDEGETIAGRKARFCDVVLGDYFRTREVSDLSRQHFKLVKEGETLSIVDMASTNGTEVDGVSLTPGTPQLLRHGSRIRLAKDPRFVIEVHFQDDPEVTTVKPLYPDGIYFDEQAARFLVNRKPIPDFALTELELGLLKYLYDHIGQVCTYDDLAFGVWLGGDVQNNAIAQTVGKLRKKLNRVSAGAGKEYIETLYGRGYRLKRQDG